MMAVVLLLDIGLATRRSTDGGIYWALTRLLAWIACDRVVVVIINIIVQALCRDVGILDGWMKE
jgi:hypothetical protein